MNLDTANQNVSNQPSGPLTDNRDPLVQFLRQYNRKTKLIVSISVIGLVLFIIMALVFPFKDKFFDILYPKPKSQAAVCNGNSQLPAERGGFVYTGGDLNQAITSLKTPLYYTYDANLGPKKTVYMIGKYTQNYADPLGLRLLMDNNLSNTEFKGLWGQSPVGWNLVTSPQGGNASIETVLENTLSGGTSLKISNINSPSGTQVWQAYKKNVSSGQIVVFATWIKTTNPASVKIFIQNSQAPFQEFGNADLSILPNEWSYVTGFGKVPDGVTNFQVSMRVTGQNSIAWFQNVTAAAFEQDANQTLSNMVLERCGAAWLIDNEPGWDQTYAPPHMKPVSADLYALIYHQFYTLIKNIDSGAIILPGGLSGAPIAFETTDGSFSPKSFLGHFRNSYKNFFAVEPPVDALGIGYLATDQSTWSGSNLAAYMTNFRSYIDSIPEWKGKPIWISKLGVSKDAPGGGVDFLKAAVGFLSANNLNIARWFWFDTCGYNVHLTSLFSANNKICSWPMNLSALGQAYLAASITPTVQPTVVPTASTASPSATITSVPNSPTPTPEVTVIPTPTLIPSNTPTVTPVVTVEPSTPSATLTP